jgi:hypothetical protein
MLLVVTLATMMLLVEPDQNARLREEACTQAQPLPKQEMMPSARRLARQRAFQRRVQADQPTLRELLATESYFDARQHGPGQPAPVTAILNVWNRHTLCRQLDALLGQTAPPAHIWVCVFGPSPLFEAAGAAVASYNDSRIVLLRSRHNLKYYGRFQMAMLAPTPYFHVIDDDMIPGRRYVEALLHVSRLRPPNARRRLLGSIGWLLPPPQAGLTFGSYRSTANDSGGLYVPDVAYGISVDRLLEVDYLCSMWFGQTRWLRQLWRDRPLTFDTGEDFHLSHMLRKYARVDSFVMPVSAGQPETWGYTDHRLAYSRYSTGGAATIRIRDQIWWDALTSGASFTWAKPSSPPALRAPLEAAAVRLLLVDGEAHARALAPLFTALATGRANGGQRATPLLVLTNSQRVGRGGAAGFGGWLAECSAVAPIFGLDRRACVEPRLRILALDLIRDQPVDARAALRSDASPPNHFWRQRGTHFAPEHRQAADGRPAGASQDAEASPARRRVLAALPRLPADADVEFASGHPLLPKPARQQAAAIKGLGEMVRLLRPAALYWVSDPASAAVRAAEQLVRLHQLQGHRQLAFSLEQPRLTQQALAFAAVSPDAPPWFGQSLAALSPRRLQHLRKPHATTVAVTVVPTPQAMGALSSSLGRVLWLGPCPTLRLLLPAPFSAQALAAAQAWPWDGKKQMVARVTEPSAVADMTLAAWMPEDDDAVSLTS